MLHPLKPSSRTAINRPGRKRNLVPILSPCPLSALEPPEGLDAAEPRSKSTFICVSGISGKSNQRWVIGTSKARESCPRSFLLYAIRNWSRQVRAVNSTANHSVAEFRMPPRRRWSSESASLAASGNRISTSRPPSGRLDAFTVPPCSRTARSVIARPSPAPPVLRPRASSMR